MSVEKNSFCLSGCEGECESVVFGREQDTTAALEEYTSWWGTWTRGYEKECARVSAIQVGVPKAWAQGKLPGRGGI